MTKSVSLKMGLKENMRAVYVNAPREAIRDIDAPRLDLQSTVRGQFDYIHLFVNDQADFHKNFPRMMKHLRKTGSLWLSWPKKGKNGTDLNLPTVIKIGYDYGLVESKCLSINETWSALKFTFPKEGKVYNNSFGKLKE